MELAMNPAVARRWTRRLPLIAGLALIGSFIAGRAIVEIASIPLPLRILAAVLPGAIFIIWITVCVRAARNVADELERRVQLEALAFAFPCAFALLMALGLLERVIKLPPEDLSYRHVWAMLPLFYLAGLTIARKRYA